MENTCFGVSLLSATHLCKLPHNLVIFSQKVALGGLFSSIDAHLSLKNVYYSKKRSCHVE